MTTMKSKGEPSLKVLEVIKKGKHVGMVSGGKGLAEIGTVALMMVPCSGTPGRLLTTSIDREVGLQTMIETPLQLDSPATEATSRRGIRGKWRIKELLEPRRVQVEG